MKSYFKFLSRNLFYTLIEAAGLTISLAFVILIGCCAWQQYAITLEHHDRKLLYVPNIGNHDMGYGFKSVVEERVPEVEQVVQLSGFYTYDYAGDEGNVPVNLIATEKAFFDMFPRYRILKGSADALLSKDVVLVSQTFANTHGIELGATLEIGSFSVTVGGIVEDFRNTTFRYVDIIASIEHERFRQSREQPFEFLDAFSSIIKLRKGSDVEVVKQKMEDICKKVYPRLYGQPGYEDLTLTRFDNIYFNFMVVRNAAFNKGNDDNVLVLMFVGLLLLFSSIFNYVNLNTALVGRRAKEMAVRRLVGAQRAAIVGRYIGESIGFTALCFGMALPLAMAFAPVLEQLVNEPSMSFAVVFTPATVTGYFILIVLVGTLSGLIPALFASRFQPIDIVKGKFKMHNKMTFSRVFIVLQNALTVFFLAMALVMEAQYEKSLHRPLNANIEDKYFLQPSIIGGNHLLQDVFASLPCIKRVGRATATPVNAGWGRDRVTRSGERILLYEFLMDTTAFAMLDIEKKLDFNAPLYNSVWFSESAFTAAGLNEEDYNVSGIFSPEEEYNQQAAGTFVDFAVNDCNKKITMDEYAMLVLWSEKDIPAHCAYLLETVGDHKEAKQQIEDAYAKWTKENFNTTSEPLRSYYLTDHIIDAMKFDHDTMRLLELFMLAAILISTLGLLAMSTYYAGEQAKAIAIRKAVGGTVVSETVKNVRSYMIMVGVACMIALPPAVWVADKYVERFVYRIENYWWIFLVAVVLAVAIAFAAVFWQVWSAARTNPVVELKKE